MHVGFNDLATTRPDVCEYLLYKDDAYRYTQKSSKVVFWRCPICFYTDERPIRNVTRRGYTCPACSDGISYPNKYIWNVVCQLGLNAKREVTFDWSSTKRYDIWIQPNTIIEMNGEQHYRSVGGWGIEYPAIKLNDEEKRKLAIDNGITHYITIDARVSESMYISKNILNSEMNELYDLSTIDWDKANMFAKSSIIEDIKKNWDETKSVSQIEKNTKLSKDVIRACLHELTKDGICDYDPRAAMAQHNGKNHRKKVMCTTTGVCFNSIKEAGMYYGVSPNAIGNALTGYCKSSGKTTSGEKLYWKYDGEGY